MRLMATAGTSALTKTADSCTRYRQSVAVRRCITGWSRKRAPDISAKPRARYSRKPQPGRSPSGPRNHFDSEGGSGIEGEVCDELAVRSGRASRCGWGLAGESVMGPFKHYARGQQAGVLFWKREMENDEHECDHRKYQHAAFRPDRAAGEPCRPLKGRIQQVSG